VVNGRILPGDRGEDVRRTLVSVLADEPIKVTPIGEEIGAHRHRSIPGSWHPSSA
jgi:hypothetical protein